MKAKSGTPEGRRIYSRRIITVEPVFANVRAQKRMDRYDLEIDTELTKPSKAAESIISLARTKFPNCVP